MKKLLSLALLVPLVGSASTASLSPATVSLTEGQTITLTILVDPQGSAYTAKIALSYPANLLSVTSFNQAAGWLTLTQPGYDLIDNTSGTLIKTAGYSGGISSPKVFGTVTFRALASGTATIVMNGSTQILDANNTNTFTSGGRATVSITKPISVPTKPVAKPLPKASSTPDRQWLATSTATTTPAIQNQANAGSMLRDKDSSIGLSALLAAVTFFLGLALGRLRARS